MLLSKAILGAVAAPMVLSLSSFSKHEDLLVTRFEPESLQSIEVELLLRACSGSREDQDVCQGAFLSRRHSYHNCKNSGGRCCALQRNGSGGLDVDKGRGGEDCGYCFSGKCKREK
ncbi:hypothetical protein F5B20DRAFT_522095 [Whalleya microplaca]|nr:hypothetical protein F5B20DRAFT_522095 [Whalleya microplaca]